ncbi:SGNH/GDSL hydrolase family protein [Persicitalea sp.]|uniref:SGNH/GDSL hydrolase family protein n=1 Tax=Persicitalea sp. TaxID=3100273 RepID=UPI00359470F9
MENRAIGGFSSDRLKLMVDNDVVPFYPDLILFHDYGSEPDYEQIIRTIRSRTTADIIIQTDHIGVGQNQEWHDQHSNVWLPALCNTYGLALVDVRAAWKAYLEQNQLPTAKLLSDNVHLNDHGNYLMAKIIERYLEALPQQTSNATTAVRILRRGQDFSPKQDKIQLPATGNRIDLVWSANDNPAGSVAVTIDGQRPSAQLPTYYHTRPALKSTGFFLNHMGQLLAMRLGGQPQAEDWILTVTDVDSVGQQLRFRLSGSRTGDDGSGSSDQPFVSTSGRIVIDSTGWFRRKNAGDFGQFPWLRPGDQLRWQVVSTSQDLCLPASGQATTVVQGIANTDHRLKLTGKGVNAISEIRIYQPPLRP